MDPVEPSTAIFFHMSVSSSIILCLFSASQEQRQIVYDRRSENDTVEPVQDPAVSGNQFPVIFDVVIALDGRRRQITDL